MGTIRIVTDIDRRVWSDFVFNHPHGNIFQTPNMYDIYKDTKGCQPVFLAAVDKNNVLAGIILTVIQKEPFGVFSRFTTRAIVWGGPLISSNYEGEEVAGLLLREADNILKSKALFIEFRNIWDTSNLNKFFIKNNYIYTEHLNFLADLSIGEETLWRNISSSGKNKIRKAYKEAVEARPASSPTDIKESYKILEQVYRRVGLPLTDISLFENAYKILYPENHFKIFLALYKNNIIGTLYLLVFKKDLYIWYSGALSGYFDKNPNDILHWEAIRWGCQNGFRILDFGGAGRPSDEYGVRDFKEKFGGRQVAYGRFNKSYRPFLTKMAKWTLNLWKKI